MNTAERYERNKAVINHYNSNERISDIALLFNITMATVMNIVREGRDMGVVTRVPRSRRADNVERDAEIVHAYNAGDSMEKIGVTYKLSRERVRQILANSGVKSRSMRDYFAGAYSTWAEHHGAEVTEVFEKTRSISKTIEELSSYSEVWVRRFLADRRHETVRTHGAERFWTNERIISALQSASEDGVLTIPRYQKWRISGATIEGKIPPTHTLIVWRFGTWNDALAAAGLRTSERKNHRVYSRSWSADDAIVAVKTYTHQSLRDNVRPTLAGYEKWCHENPGNPSGSYLRYLTGKPWADILREALNTYSA
jgi:transposase